MVGTAPTPDAPAAGAHAPDVCRIETTPLARLISTTQADGKRKVRISAIHWPRTIWTEPTGEASRSSTVPLRIPSTKKRLASLSSRGSSPAKTGTAKLPAGRKSLKGANNRENDRDRFAPIGKGFPTTGSRG